jgi:NADH-quinone oxidoreductase subunit C
VIELLQAEMADCITSAVEEADTLRLSVTPEGLLAVCEMLRDHPGLSFHYPADLTAWETDEGFTVWYRLWSMTHRRTALLKVHLPHAEPFVPSVAYLWPGMSWHERECFDLFGIQFPGHPDQDDPARMRILLPEDWDGHPFRRDYTPVFTGNPLHGPQETN